MLEVGSLLVRGCLAAFLGSTGVSKLRPVSSPPDYLRKLPVGAWRGLGLIEVLLGVALLTPGLWATAAVLSTALFATFAVVGWSVSHKGAKGPCACGGFLPLPEMGWTHVALVGGLALTLLRVKPARIHQVYGHFA